MRPDVRHQDHHQGPGGQSVEDGREVVRQIGGQSGGDQPGGFGGEQRHRLGAEIQVPLGAPQVEMQR